MEIELTLVFLAILFLATVAANGVVPLLPVTAYVIWLAQQLAPFPVYLIYIALIATLGSVIGWAALERWFTRRYGDSLPRLEQKIPAVYRRFFLKNTALSLLIVNAIPFPGDPIRILASLSGYSRSKALWLIGVGRFIRYALLVFIGALLESYQTLLWAILIFFLILPALSWAGGRIRKPSSLPGGILLNNGAKLAPCPPPQQSPPV